MNTVIFFKNIKKTLDKPANLLYNNILYHNLFLCRNLPYHTSFVNSIAHNGSDCNSSEEIFFGFSAKIQGGTRLW